MSNMESRAHDETAMDSMVGQVGSGEVGNPPLGERVEGLALDAQVEWLNQRLNRAMVELNLVRREYAAALSREADLIRGIRAWFDAPTHGNKTMAEAWLRHVLSIAEDAEAEKTRDRVLG